ncbi:MAG: hypothetical protein Q4D38_11820, partial [Planctomycetia bacterium]|nr:hypothetical protein [Planctomycetia bacterium]
MERRVGEFPLSQRCGLCEPWCVAPTADGTGNFNAKYYKNSPLPEGRLREADGVFGLRERFPHFRNYPTTHQCAGACKLMLRKWAKYGNLV